MRLEFDFRAAGVRELLCKPYSTEEFCRVIHSGLHNAEQNP